MSCLYRRLLGPAFDSLPPTLRDFHDVERERFFQATFRVTRGRGFLRNLLGKLGGLPAAGDAVPLRLRVFPDSDAEHWQRQFGEHRLDSVQRVQDGLMVESFGNGWRLGFQLHVEGPALRLEMRKAWFLGVRWPLWLSPGGDGIEMGLDAGCAIVARGTAPLLGMIIQYEGLVTPLPGATDLRV